MRRSDREINVLDEIVEVMRKCEICRLGLQDEGVPYIVPLNFGMTVEGTQITLYFHGAREGRKLDLMKKNPRVCFEMDTEQKLFYEEDKRNCSMAYECVMGTGTVAFLEGEEKEQALHILMRHYYGEEEKPFDARVIPMTNVWKVTVEELSAKRRPLK